MKRFIAPAGLLLSLALAARMGSAQTGPAWSTFQSDMGRSGVSSVSGPTDNTVAAIFTLRKPVYGSPVVDANGIAYVGDQDGKVYALDPHAAAAPKWTFTTKGPVVSTPTLSSDGKELFVGSDDGHVYAVNTATGAEIWDSALGGAVRGSPILASDGTLYVSDIQGEVYALGGSDGKQIWNVSLDGAVPGSLSLSQDGLLYVGSTNESMYSIGTGSNGGKVQQQYYLDGAAGGSPSIDQNTNIYITTQVGSLMSFSPGSTTARWTFQSNQHLSSVSTPASGDNLSVFGDSDGNLYGIAASSGSDVFTFHTGAQITGSPVIATGNNRIYFGSNDTNVYCLDTNGNKIWSKSLGAPIVSSPALGPDGSLWVATTGGQVFQFAPLAVPPPPSTPVPGQHPTPAPTTAVATATAAPTATTTGAALSVTPSGNVAPGNKETLTVRTQAANTLVHIRVNYPNGDHQSASVTTGSSGTVTYTYSQAASKIKHNRLYAHITATAGTATATAQYKILFGHVDVSVEPRKDRVGHTVDIWIHSKAGTTVAAILSGNHHKLRLTGRTGKKGWAHLRWKVSAYVKGPGTATVTVTAQVVSRSPHYTTKTTLKVP